MKDKLNSKWTMKDIAQEYKKENPKYTSIFNNKSNTLQIK